MIRRIGFTLVTLEDSDLQQPLVLSRSLGSGAGGTRLPAHRRQNTPGCSSPPGNRENQSGLGFHRRSSGHRPGYTGALYPGGHEPRRRRTYRGHDSRCLQGPRWRADLGPGRAVEETIYTDEP